MTTEAERKEILQGMHTDNTDKLTKYAVKLFKGELYQIFFNHVCTAITNDNFKKILSSYHL